MSDTNSQLPKDVCLPKDVHEQFAKESRLDGALMKEASESLGFPVYEQAVFQREQGYFMGAKTEYFRSQKRMQEEMINLLTWACTEGYDKPTAIELTLRIKGMNYTIPE